MRNTDGLLIAQASRSVLGSLEKSPHQALLLSGQKGIGKSLLAKRMVSDWLGLEVSKVDESQYVRLVVPEKETISIEQIRGLRQFVQLKESRAGALQRVILLVDADEMTIPAQNALLKLLEEPPSGVGILLTTSSSRKLLPTILSRVQMVQLHTPTEREAVDFFVQQGMPESDAARAYAMADGSIADMSAVLRKESKSETTTMDLARRILQATRYDRLCMIDQELKDKAVATEVVTAVGRLASAALHISTSPAKIAQWHRVLQACTVAEDALSHNASSKLALTELMLTL